MCIISSDRNSGITKIHNLIPKEFMDNVLVFPIDTYEELVSSTAIAKKKLDEHYKKTGVHGWIVIELLEEAWRFSQDYYSRKAFGETLADLMAAKRQEIQELMKSKNKEAKATAYQALEGFKDWVIVKFYHNFNWIDKVKKFPYNVLCTCEIKEETNKDSIFYESKWRPAGEKDNVHRFDTVIYLTHKGNNFMMKPYKLTGFTKLYGELNVTNKNIYTEHKKACERLAELGYKSTAIEELEKSAGVLPPKKSPAKEDEEKAEKQVEQKESKEEEISWDI
jgi:hypothetical protein